MDDDHGSDLKKTREVYVKDPGSCEYPKGRTITRGEWERQQREGWGVDPDLA